jgi:hypothetical protein
MKSYSVDIQVDFDVPRAMPPREGATGTWRAVGYFQYFYCSERSKDKAKKLVLDFVMGNEEQLERCQFRCDRIAWMCGLTTREEIAFGNAVELTEEMFEKKNEIGIWFHTDKKYYVSEVDCVASMLDINEYEESDDSS